MMTYQLYTQIPLPLIPDRILKSKNNTPPLATMTGENGRSA